jgi:hypothetical protein
VVKSSHLLAVILLPILFAAHSAASDQIEKEHSMSTTGNFEVDLSPQQDENAPAGRMIINKNYSGGMDGTGTGQMLSKRTDSGVAVYSAIEEFAGSIEGKNGSFTLIHKGYMSSENQSLEITILEGSGTDELKSISGSMTITQEDGGHQYELNYSLTD